MPSLLVAGYGFLGKALGELAAGQGWAVHGWRRTPRAEPDASPVSACDLSRAESVAAAAAPLPWIPDAVVHCASSSGGGADSYRAVYLEGMRNLRRAFAGTRLVFVSSTSVYGQTDGAWVSEESPTLPGRETGQILLEAEAEALGAGGTVARLAGLYGPGRSVLLRMFLEGGARIEGGEGRHLNQIHRDDAAEAVLLLAGRSETAGRIFNVADDCPMTQRACFTALAELFARPVPPDSPPDLGRKRAWTDKRVSNARLRALGWVPRYPSFMDAVRARAAD